MIGDQNPNTTRVEHLAGCPQSRTENYPVRRTDGSTVNVTRCVDCGAHAVEPR